MKCVLKNVLSIVLVFSLLLMNSLQAMAEENNQTTECNIISIALDVSGSMKTKDSHRHSIELIKLCMDICNDSDYFSVTAYNDQIVYHSGLVSGGDEEGKENLVEELDALQFGGETDNGLGLLKATTVIADADIEYDNAFIIMVSDGNTDLINSKTGRTTADSDADMRASIEIAIENDIMINVVSYTNAYNQDTGLLSVVSASTGGSTTVVDNPTQFIQVVLGTFFYGYEKGKVNFQVSETTELVNRYETNIEIPQNQRCYAVFFTVESMTNCEVVNVEDNTKIFQRGNYLIQRIDEEGKYDLKAIYSLEKPSTLISGTIRIEKDEPVVIVPEPTTPPVVEEPGMPPKGQNVEKQLYTSKDVWVTDVSAYFEDADNDIVKYSVIQKAGDAECVLSGSMLSVYINQAGNNKYLIVAEDSKQNKEEITFDLEVVAAWKQYRGIVTIVLICFILLIAVAICAYIIKAVLFGKRKVQNAISGSLKAYFIDLKSKNESVDLIWNMEDYPPEGVTLEELFLSKGIRENFKDVEKVCFYPGRNSNELLLVHCIEGGVFLREQNVRANKPVAVCSGDVLYISFAENASEIELKYTAKSDCLDR